MPPEEVAGRIDYTFLKHDATLEAFDSFLERSLTFPFACVMVPPAFVTRAVGFCKRRTGAACKVGSVAAFPLGYSSLRMKHHEMEEMLDQGALEVDLVQNIALFRSDFPAWRDEVWSCAELARSYRGALKLILETNLLGDEEIVMGAKAAIEAGAHFLKTGTGYFGDARVEHVKTLRKAAGDRVQVKAAGGIKTFEQFRAMIEAGADRVGSSAGYEIVQSVKH
ncbi:MAG: deoxyribose-phosphate aldolase [bacterium]